LTETLKLRAGQFKIPVEMTKVNGKLFFKFPYNKHLLSEIKSMKGSRWHGFEDPPRKEWSVTDCERNRFQLDFLMGNNPYKHYDLPIKESNFTRANLYNHQKEMINFGLTRKKCILACEMGTGKTLAAIEIMEQSGYTNWVWVGPASAIAAVKLEFEIWNAKILPRFTTYGKLENELCDGIIIDESSKIKNATTQRAQRVVKFIEDMKKYNEDCYIILMSGAPAPKAPPDWHNQAETVCPGFLKEGDANKLKHTLALITEEKSITGGVFPKLVTWLDDENKCKHCGMYREDHILEEHTFEKSVNEVSRLYRRMDGLVYVKFKKDVMDLPEKQFKIIKTSPSPSLERLVKTILKTEARAISALMKIRELSDGFLYEETKSNEKETCQVCKGHKVYRKETCTLCKGTGEVLKTIRTAKRIDCPKDKVFVDLLDQHEPIGRFVTFAGFTETVDKLTEISLKYQWNVIRVDGRGWKYFPEGPNDSKDMLKLFQSKEDKNIIFIGNPGSAGMGLTLTASPSAFFYSNSFNGEDRIQAIERIHRPGMDINKGATIIDIIHLEIDTHILNNLNKKINLLKLTMGDLNGYYKS
jgi:SNF2 family DNA or RNA helicase